MIRASRPADVIRYGVFGGPAPGNRAYPLAAIGTDSTVAMSKRDVMATVASLRNRGTYSLTLSHDRYVPAIIAAQPRSSRRCWDVTHLLVDSPDGAECHDVLGILFREISQRGGERVFLRLREDDPLVQLSASCGFTKYGEEALLTGPKVSFPDASAQDIRPVKQIDEHDLFRIYNASTPSRARFALGMTADQWRAAREPAGWRSREYIYRQDDTTRGWVQITRRGRSAIVTLLNHPGADDCIPGLVSHGMARAWGVKNWYILARDNQGRFEALMRQRGYREITRYVTMARAITSPVTIAEASRAVRITGLNPAVDLSERLQSSTREESYAAHNT